jgi:DNA-directed RNA polymerase specialized sigma24 family protein
VQGGTLTLDVLCNMFRSYYEWRSLFENEGIDVLTFGGEDYSLWDLEYLVGEIHRLPEFQQRAIYLCLIEGRSRSEAAVAVGTSPGNPMTMYARAGVKKILDLIEAGELPRFRVAERV